MTHVMVIVPVSDETTVLFFLTRLLGVGHSEVVVLAVQPVAQTGKLRCCKIGREIIEVNFLYCIYCFI